MTGLPPVPEAVERVRSFINTADLESRTDEIDTPESLSTWLATRELLDASIVLGDTDVARVLSVREALRDVLEGHEVGGVAESALAVVNEAARSAPLVVTFDSTGHASLAPGAGGIDAALGRILADVAVSVSEGTWSRLKVCRSDVCRWAFYDRSRNRSGAWCDMAVCGNRMKGRAFRRRRRLAQPAAV
jgi:predicted RNA-binding Zn ribbon-like protein